MENRDKSKRSSSFLDKFNPLRAKHDKKEKPERKSSRLPSLDESSGQSGMAANYMQIVTTMSKEDIHQKFEQMLDDMNLTEEKKAPLRKQGDEQKKVMLTMHLMQSSGKNDTPPQFINWLKQDNMSPEDRQELMESLRVALTNNPVSWVQEFGTAGLNAILRNLTYCCDSKTDKDRKTTLGCIKCLKAFMNNRFGLMQIINHEEALIILARSIDPRYPASMLEAVQLLGAICLVPPDGHDKALEGITVYGEMKQQDRFSPIVQGLAMNDSNMKVACLQLINALVNTPDDIDFRLHLRNEFLRTGLIDALGDLEQIEHELVRTQVNIFNDFKEEDFEEFSHRYDNVRIELDDARECFELLYQTTLHTQSEAFFLSCLQHMLCIRDDIIARPNYFKLIEECIAQIVLHRSGVDPDFRHTKRFDIDVEPLLGRLAEDSLEGELAGGVAPRNFKSKLEEALTAKQEMEAKVTTLEEKVKQFESENNELKQKIQMGLAGAIMNPGGAPGGCPVPPPPPLPPGGPAPPPPPPLPGGAIPPPPPPPPFGGGPPPPPPPPPPGGGPPPPPPPPGGGPPPPPPPPGMGGPPPPPFGMPMPAHPMTPPSNVLPFGMKQKQKYEPAIQMKRANWNKVAANKLEKDSFWVKVQEEQLASKDIFSALQEAFASKAPPKKIESNTAAKGVAQKKKGKELKVLAPKDGQNLSILLGSIKVPYTEIRRRILEVDEDNLTSAMLEQLIKYMPAPEQLQQLQSFKDQYDELSEAEQFGVTMCSIKRLVPRMTSILFKMNFNEQISEIKPDIVATTEALEEIKQSGKFSRILELILLMGNYMNAGSRNAQSIGFDISYLTKLSNTKSADGKKTLLHFLVETLETKYPDCLSFRDELIHVEQASRVSEDNVKTRLRQMGNQLKQLEIDVKNAENDKNAAPNDRFSQVMDNFSNQAKEQHEVLEGMGKRMSTLYEATAKFYAFDQNKYAMEEFFSDIKNFCDQFTSAQKELAKIREAEEKQKRALEAQERRQRDKEEKQARQKALIDISADDDQEGVMDSLLEALKTGSAFNVRGEKKRRTPRAAGAERRAALSRSRSRQNIFQPNQSQEIVREINFEKESGDDSTINNNNTIDLSGGNNSKSSTEPVVKGHRKARPKGERTGNGVVKSKGGGDVGSMSEAEELLKRLQEL